MAIPLVVARYMVPSLSSVMARIDSDGSPSFLLYERNVLFSKTTAPLSFVPIQRRFLLSANRLTTFAMPVSAELMRSNVLPS